MMFQPILVISANPFSRGRVARLFEQVGQRPLMADTGGALAAIREAQPDLVVLACEDEFEPLLEICRSIRRITRIPVLISPAVHSDADEVAALAGGADDYVARSSSDSVLLARADRLLGRARERANHRHVYGDLLIDIAARSVRYAGRELPLTRMEFDLLALMVSNSHRVVRRNELLTNLWGDWYGDDHILDVHISRLRGKLRKHAAAVDLQPVRGVGYRLNATAA